MSKLKASAKPKFDDLIKSKIKLEFETDLADDVTLNAKVDGQILSAINGDDKAKVSGEIKVTKRF